MDLNNLNNLNNPIKKKRGRKPIKKDDEEIIKKIPKKEVENLLKKIQTKHLKYQKKEDVNQKKKMKLQ